MGMAWPTSPHGSPSWRGWTLSTGRCWPLLAAPYWNDTPQDNDRQRRKQAEFLVWQSLDWRLIGGIRVLNPAMKQRVEGILQQHPQHRPVTVKVAPSLYY